MLHDAHEADAQENRRAPLPEGITEHTCDDERAEFDSHEPVPLDAPPAVPPFPVEALSPWIRDIVHASARVLQVPADLPAVLVLAMIGAALSHRCRLSAWDGWEESPNLYVMAIASSGENKSATLNALTAPILEAERARASLMVEKIRAARSDQAMLTARVAALRTTVAKKGGATNEAALATAEKDLAELVVPASPRVMIGGDATPEALGLLLAQQGERMLVASAEGGAVDDLTGLRYGKSGSPSLDLVLKCYAGERVTVDRVGRPPLVLHAPLLSLALAVQPDVWRAASARADLSSRGVIPRFIVAWPDSLVGSRDMGPQSWPAGARETYGDLMRRLWDLTLPTVAGVEKPAVIPFDDEARALFVSWRHHIEEQQRPGGLYSEPPVLMAWCGKLHGTCVRVAGLLHVADRVGVDKDDLFGGSIDVATVTRAIRVAEYLAAHAVRAFVTASGAASAAQEDARLILASIRHRKLTGTISLRDLMRSRSHCTTERAAAAAAILTEHGWLAELPAPPRPKGAPGRPRSPTFALHPRVASRPTPTRPASPPAVAEAPRAVDDIDAITTDALVAPDPPDADLDSVDIVDTPGRLPRVKGRVCL